VSVSTARIRLLPQAVADAIAAGEVVERPASVVKELCENSLDAGATRIDVEIERGGLIRLCVTDDGCGIDASELRLAVSRHATSKIESDRDLERVRTLGFRGEALASIAAVSDLRLVSRPPGVDAAATIRVRSGEIAESGPAAAAPGTRVEVCELFASTPARLRFMREARTESSHAARLVGELALTHPRVAFSCTVDGRTAVRTAGLGRADALRSVFGAAASKSFIEVSAAGAVSVEGWISGPLAHRGTRSAMVLVVNGRRVHNRSLLFALDEAYHGLLPQGRHPFGVVLVELDPAEVDVNVHPTKREVRFRDEREVFAAVQRACWSALRANPVMVHAPPVKVPAAGGEAFVLGLADARDEDERERQRSASPEPSDLRGTAAGLRAIGQVRGEWIVAESADGLVLVDPHAAHEKVLYVRLLDEWSKGERSGTESQLLLLPSVVECDAAAMQRYETNAAFLESCGFGLEPFGPGLVRCTAVPLAAAAADPARIVLDALDSFDDDAPPAQRRHRLAALVACHSAVRFGDRLQIDNQQQLLDELAGTAGGSTCPHGRPTTLAIDDAYLRRAFHRSAR